jgi:predicted nucleotidyltransferase
MDLSNPASSILGRNQARVLHRLAVLADGASGRRIHELSGVKALRTTQQILEKLVSTGLVDLRRVGSSNEYSLNRDHVLWEPIEAILATPARAEKRIAEVLTRALGDHAGGISLYGSFARGEGGPDSDIDILVVWNEDTDEALATEILDGAAQQIRRVTGNRAQLLAVTQSELDRLVATNDPLVESLRRDARQLTTGIPIRNRLRGAR